METFTHAESSTPECDSGAIPVHVYCRLRPPAVLEKINWLHVRNATTIEVNVPPELQQLPRGTLRKCEYTFRQVFDAAAKQQDVFEAVAKPLVDNLIMGRNSLLLSYGITGSGKTYTMTGNAEQDGITQYALFEIFNAIDDYQTKRSVLKVDGMNGFEFVAQHEGALSPETPSGGGEHPLYALFVNYVEFYNNSVYDLLEPCGLQKPLQSRLIREDGQRNQMYVHGVTEVEVKSYAEALEVFRFGQKRKRVAHTLLNTASSRSHSSFNIRLVRLSDAASDGHDAVTSQLSLVDLAGSERSARTKNCGIRLREASSINNSLLTLRTCLEYLRENQRAAAGAQTLKKIPYRDAKLTHMFKHFFEGAGQVSMIVCVNTQLNDMSENLHVFKFAEMTRELQIARPLEQPKMKLCTLPNNNNNMAAKSEQLQIDQATETETLLQPLNMTDSHFVLGANFPHYEDDAAAADIDFDELTSYLQQRISCRHLLRIQLETHFDLVYQQLLQLQQENVDLRRVLAKTSDALQQALAQEAAMAEQLCTVEERSAKLAQNLLKRQSQVEALQLEVSAKDELLQQKMQNEWNWKESMRYQVAYAKEQTMCELGDEWRKRTEEFEEQIRIKDEKLRLVASILQAEDMPTLRLSISTQMEQHSQQQEEHVLAEKKSIDANTQTMRTLMADLRHSTMDEVSVEDTTIVEAKNEYLKKHF